MTTHGGFASISYELTTLLLTRLLYHCYDEKKQALYELVDKLMGKKQVSKSCTYVGTEASGVDPDIVPPPLKAGEDREEMNVARDEGVGDDMARLII